MKKQTKRILVSMLALLLLLCSGCAGEGPYKTGENFRDFERIWACEDLYVETFIFSETSGYRTDAYDYIVLTVEDQTLQLSHAYYHSTNYECFYLRYTEEDMAKIEAGGSSSRKAVWQISSNLQGKTLTITVLSDNGYKNGLYSVDHTGKTFVLTEQSRVL